MRFAVLLGVLVLSITPAVASASITFKGGFETNDLSQWGEKINAHRISVVSSPVFEGTKAGRFEIRKGDTALANQLVRVELGWNPSGKMEGTEGYYAWRAMPSIDQPFVVGSHQITYWECDTIYKQVMSFHVTGEEVSLATRLPTSKTIWTGSFMKGAWHHFVLHVKWSPDATVGFVELWYEGTKVVDKTLVATQHRDGGGVALDNFLHQGIFRGADTIVPTEVMFLDGTIAGTTLADVSDPVVDAGIDAAADAKADAQSDAVAIDSVTTTDAPAAETATPDVGIYDASDDAATPDAGTTEEDGGCTTGRSSRGHAWLLLAFALFARRRR